MIKGTVLAGIMAACSVAANAQILTYTTDTIGAYATVATNAAASGLGRANGAAHPSAICHLGYSASNFPSTSTYASIDPCDTVTVHPLAGYKLSVTSFSVGIRRSSTGPQNVRFAYKLDTDPSWTTQGTDQSPNNAGCDTATTATWTLTSALNVPFPRVLEFAVFGFNATSTNGTFQIDTFKINGTVVSSTGLNSVEADPVGFYVFPNPTNGAATLSYNLDAADQVTLAVYNMLGQQVMQLQNEHQAAGKYTYSVQPAATGIYFARLTIGGQTYSQKFVKN